MKMKRSIKAIFRRGQTSKLEGQIHTPEDLSRASSVTNLNSLDSTKGKGAKPRKSASRDRLDKIGEKKNEKKVLSKNNNKLDVDDQLQQQYSTETATATQEVELLQKQLQDMANEKTNLALQLGEHKGQLNLLQNEISKLKMFHEQSSVQLEQLTEENTMLRNRLRDVAHSPLSDNEKQQLLYESHRHHNSAPASIATNILDDTNGGDVTACPTPEWDKQSSGNVSEVSVACLQDKINQMQETHYSTNEELQATLQELTDLQRQLTELQQENERLVEEKSLMFDSLCRQTERLNDSRLEADSLKQLLYRDKDDKEGAYESAAEREQRLVELLKSAQQEREELLLKQEQLSGELQESRESDLARAGDVQRLGERVRTLESTLDAKHAEHRQLDQELAQARDQCSGRQIEINRLKDLLEIARTNISELEKDRALSDKSELDELLDSARKEKDALERETADLKEQLALSKNEVEKLREQVSILQEECKVIRNNAKTTQSDLEYKNEKLLLEKTALTDQLQQFQDALNELQVQAQCQSEDKRQLSAVLSETQRNLSEAERKIASLDDEICELQKLRKDENEEWEKFQNDLLTSVRVANDFKTEAQQDLQKMIMENKAHRERVRQLENQIDKLKGGASVIRIFENGDSSVQGNSTFFDMAGSSTATSSGKSAKGKQQNQPSVEPNKDFEPKVKQYSVRKKNVLVVNEVKKRDTPNKSKRKEKTLSKEEKQLLSSLDVLYKEIDPHLPAEKLNKEQMAVKKLKELYEDKTLKQKPVAPTSKDRLAISKPLLDSVYKNPKLQNIATSSKFLHVENIEIVNDPENLESALAFEKRAKYRRPGTEEPESPDPRVDLRERVMSPTPNKLHKVKSEYFDNRISGDCIEKQLVKSLSLDDVPNFPHSNKLGLLRLSSAEDLRMYEDRRTSDTRVSTKKPTEKPYYSNTSLNILLRNDSDTVSDNGTASRSDVPIEIREPKQSITFANTESEPSKPRTSGSKAQKFLPKIMFGSKPKTTSLDADKEKAIADGSSKKVIPVGKTTNPSTLQPKPFRKAPPPPKKVKSKPSFRSSNIKTTFLNKIKQDKSKKKRGSSINYRTLEEICNTIDPDTPEDQLTKEQLFAKKLLASLNETGRKATLKKFAKIRVKKITISVPTKESVVRNPKLCSALHNDQRVNTFLDVGRRNSSSDTNQPSRHSMFERRFHSERYADNCPMKKSKSLNDIRFKFHTLDRDLKTNLMHKGSIPSKGNLQKDAALLDSGRKSMSLNSLGNEPHGSDVLVLKEQSKSADQNKANSLVLEKEIEQSSELNDTKEREDQTSSHVNHSEDTIDVCNPQPIVERIPTIKDTKENDSLANVEIKDGLNKVSDLTHEDLREVFTESEDLDLIDDEYQNVCKNLPDICQSVSEDLTKLETTKTTDIDVLENITDTMEISGTHIDDDPILEPPATFKDTSDSDSAENVELPTEHSFLDLETGYQKEFPGYFLETSMDDSQEECKDGISHMDSLDHVNSDQYGEALLPDDDTQDQTLVANTQEEILVADTQDGTLLADTQGESSEDTLSDSKLDQYGASLLPDDAEYERPLGLREIYKNVVREIKNRYKRDSEVSCEEHTDKWSSQDSNSNSGSECSEEIRSILTNPDSSTLNEVREQIVVEPREEVLEPHEEEQSNKPNLRDHNLNVKSDSTSGTNYLRVRDKVDHKRLSNSLDYYLCDKNQGIVEKYQRLYEQDANFLGRNYNPQPMSLTLNEDIRPKRFSAPVEYMCDCDREIVETYQRLRKEHQKIEELSKGTKDSYDWIDSQNLIDPKTKELHSDDSISKVPSNDSEILNEDSTLSEENYHKLTHDDKMKRTPLRSLLSRSEENLVTSVNQRYSAALSELNDSDMDLVERLSMKYADDEIDCKNTIVEVTNRETTQDNSPQRNDQPDTASCQQYSDESHLSDDTNQLNTTETTKLDPYGSHAEENRLKDKWLEAINTEIIDSITDHKYNDKEICLSFLNGERQYSLPSIRLKIPKIYIDSSEIKDYHVSDPKPSECDTKETCHHFLENERHFCRIDFDNPTKHVCEDTEKAEYLPHIHEGEQTKPESKGIRDSVPKDVGNFSSDPMKLEECSPKEQSIKEQVKDSKEVLKEYVSEDVEEPKSFTVDLDSKYSETVGPIHKPVPKYKQNIDKITCTVFLESERMLCAEDSFYFDEFACKNDEVQARANPDIPKVHPRKSVTKVETSSPTPIVPEDKPDSPYNFPKINFDDPQIRHYEPVYANTSIFSKRPSSLQSYSVTRKPVAAPRRTKTSLGDVSSRDNNDTQIFAKPGNHSVGEKTKDGNSVSFDGAKRIAKHDREIVTNQNSSFDKNHSTTAMEPGSSDQIGNIVQATSSSNVKVLISEKTLETSVPKVFGGVERFYDSGNDGGMKLEEEAACRMPRTTRDSSNDSGSCSNNNSSIKRTSKFSGLTSVVEPITEDVRSNDDSACAYRLPPVSSDIPEVAQTSEILDEYAHYENDSQLNLFEMDSPVSDPYLNMFKTKEQRLYEDLSGAKHHMSGFIKITTLEESDSDCGESSSSDKNLKNVTHLKCMFESRGSQEEVNVGRKPLTLKKSSETFQLPKNEIKMSARVPMFQKVEGDCPQNVGERCSVGSQKDKQKPMESPPFSGECSAENIPAAVDFPTVNMPPLLECSSDKLTVQEFSSDDKLKLSECSSDNTPEPLECSLDHRPKVVECIPSSGPRESVKKPPEHLPNYDSLERIAAFHVLNNTPSSGKKPEVSGNKVDLGFRKSDTGLRSSFTDAKKLFEQLEQTNSKSSSHSINIRKKSSGKIDIAADEKGATSAEKGIASGMQGTSKSLEVTKLPKKHSASGACCAVSDSKLNDPSNEDLHNFLGAVDSVEFHEFKMRERFVPGTDPNEMQAAAQSSVDNACKTTDDVCNPYLQLPSATDVTLRPIHEDDTGFGEAKLYKRKIVLSESDKVFSTHNMDEASGFDRHLSSCEQFERILERVKRDSNSFEKKLERNKQGPRRSKDALELKRESRSNEDLELIKESKSKDDLELKDKLRTEDDDKLQVAEKKDGCCLQYKLSEGSESSKGSDENTSHYSKSSDGKTQEVEVEEASLTYNINEEL